MKKSYILWVAILGIICQAEAQEIVINEIMYKPESRNIQEQWFELHNAGSSQVDMSGWNMSEGCEFVFPSGFVMQPDEYWVVAANVEVFKGVYPGVTNVIGGWPGKMKTHLAISDGESTIDEVNFASDGDWASRFLDASDYEHRGWAWYAEHDGMGKSLELRNDRLPHEYAHNWGSSTADYGTPGACNSIKSDDVAPLVIFVEHSPIIPSSTDEVTIRIALTDEEIDEVKASLFWRTDGTEDFNAEVLYDDGLHNDRVRGDGIYGGVIPAQSKGTIVEFYFEIKDGVEHTRIYPDVIQPTDSERTANLLYQVDEEVYEGDLPIYRVIMKEEERAELELIGSQFPDAFSNASMNATWIVADDVIQNGKSLQCRYNVGVRNRGQTTRVSIPHNYHIDIPTDRRWKSSEGFNLNATNPWSQVLGSLVFRELGVPVPDARFVQLRVNGENLMIDMQGLSYAANELYDDDFVERAWPADAGGNLYMGYTYADLAWYGPEYNYYYGVTYFKENNKMENDFSDLINMIGVFNLIDGYASEATYPEDIRGVIDVDEWMRYMAINELLGNDETCLATGSGDDVGFYISKNSGLSYVVAHDFDSLMGWGVYDSLDQGGIWRMTNVVTMNRFMKDPEFAPIYLSYLKVFAETYFSSEQMNPLLDRILKDQVTSIELETMKNFNAKRVAAVLASFPQELTVESDLSVGEDGFLMTTNSVLTLFGTADATRTRRVFVNDLEAEYSSWEGTWSLEGIPLVQGLNCITIQTMGLSGEDVEKETVEVVYNNGESIECGGNVETNACWSSGEGVHLVTSNLVIPSGVVLQIESGCIIHVQDGVSITVEDGGQLIVNGTAEAPVRFLSPSGTATGWSGLVVNGSVGSPETKISYAYFDGNNSTCVTVDGGSIVLDHVVFENNLYQYLNLLGASFLVDACVFPGSNEDKAFELVHGADGIKKQGRGIFRNCFFGKVHGYTDAMDFTGSKRVIPASYSTPIFQVIGCIFMGTEDDLLDLDGTDSWIEGNIFLHTHRGSKTPDSAAAISGGCSAYGSTELTIVGNIFYDCDSAVTAKDYNFYTLANNTILRTTNEGGIDTTSGVINLSDEDLSYNSAPGYGCYLQDNIITDFQQLVREYDTTKSVIIDTNNLFAEPLFRHTPELEETSFASREEAWVMWDWLSLCDDSPAIQAGTQGQDLGAVIARGISITGEPSDTTSSTSATLNIGFNIPAAQYAYYGFPYGSGYISYRWRLNGEEWSEELPIATPIQLDNLSNGSYYVEAIGKNDAEWYQNASDLWGETNISRSKTWIVDTSYVAPTETTSVQMNEILIPNTQEENNVGLVELYNYGPEVVDLSGMGLTNDKNNPYLFVFPEGTLIESGEYLVLSEDANVQNENGFLSLGFILPRNGGGLYLVQGVSRGSGVLDEVVFGLQASGYSIGRLGAGNWGLCVPTFGSENEAVQMADASSVCINECLCDAQFRTPYNFIELYNCSSEPVNIGGFYLSNSPGSLTLHRVADLSFIPGNGFVIFYAGEDIEQGDDHLCFELNSEVGTIYLSSPDLSLLDKISYLHQKTDVSLGRSPDGATNIVAFDFPTPSVPNPGTENVKYEVVTTENPMVKLDDSWSYYQNGSLDNVNWKDADFDDSSWSVGIGLLGYEPELLPSPGIQTELTAGRSTYYFRKKINVTTNLSDFTLDLVTVVDDGYVLHLNGQPIHTNNMPEGIPVYETKTPVSKDDAVLEYATLPGSLFVEGTNTLAVEVHQVTMGSSDVVWGMALNATRTVTNRISGVSNVILNEVLVMDDEVHSSYLEIQNLNEIEMDISGLSLTDDVSNSTKWVFPEETIMKASAFLVLECNPELPVSATNTGFQFSENGGALYLFNSPEHGGGAMDSICYGIQIPGYSIGRLDESSDKWGLTVPTPGETNSAVSVGSVSSLRINEWMASQKTGDDWLEIYNPLRSPIALGGLYLTDDFLDPFQSPIPSLSFIGTGANAYTVFYASGDILAGANHTDFSLKKDGESIGLFSQTGELLDGIVFGEQKKNISQGCYPDGTDNIVTFEQSTPGSRNVYGGQDSDEDGMPDEWEWQYGFNPSDPLDAALDADGDGQTNLHEYIAGTDPLNADDCLRIRDVNVECVDGVQWLVMSIPVVEGHAYTIECCEGGVENWSALETISTVAATGIKEWRARIDNATGRYYRVVVLAK